MRAIAAHQVNLVHLLDLREGVRIGMPRIEAAAGQWSLPGQRQCSRPARPDARQRFFAHAVRWLRFVDLFEEPCKAQHAHVGEVAVFAAWMRKERGWSEDTIRGCCSTVERFFHRLDERGIALAAVRIAGIDRAVARWHARDCSRVTIHDYAQRLRTFFRFADRQRWCTPGLADGIMPSRFHSGETVAKGLTRDEVLRLLATTEGDRPVALRDRAILMVLIAYAAGVWTGLGVEQSVGRDWRVGMFPRIWITRYDEAAEGAQPRGRSLGLYVARRVSPGWLTAQGKVSRETPEWRTRRWLSHEASVRGSDPQGALRRVLREGRRWRSS